MSKFKVGERYIVGKDIVLEGGDIIEITKAGNIFVEYKTVTGKYAFAQKMFCNDSAFANTLTLVIDRHELHITSDGTTTNAVYKLNGKVEKRAKAVCCPSDTFDFNVGAELAMKRVLGIEDKPEKVEPTYYSGKVVCVDNGGARYFEVGKVYQFVGGRIFGAHGFYSSQYETLEKANSRNGVGAKFIEYRGEQC